MIAFFFFFFLLLMRKGTCTPERLRFWSFMSEGPGRASRKYVFNVVFFLLRAIEKVVSVQIGCRLSKVGFSSSAQQSKLKINRLTRTPEPVPGPSRPGKLPFCDT